VATAAAFVFLLSVGFFVTPALMGGASSITLPMLIETFVNERLDWPLAAAASMILLAAVLAVLAAVYRVVPIRAIAEAR
jgi:ABC-type spermidine/putrescine transport system permease subunit I